MNKIASSAIVASMTLASSGAFAGGAVEPIVEPVPVVVTEGGSSSGGAGLWLALGGAILIAVLVSQDDDTDSDTPADDTPADEGSGNDIFTSGQ